MAKNSEKLCNITDSAKLRNLSANDLLSCSMCGAMASDAENVCDPVQYSVEGVLDD